MKSEIRLLLDFFVNKLSEFEKTNSREFENS